MITLLSSKGSCEDAPGTRIITLNESSTENLERVRNNFFILGIFFQEFPVGADLKKQKKILIITVA